MNNPITSVSCVHQPSKKQSAVYFSRIDGKTRRYIPTAESIKRLALWLTQNMFLHSFKMGVYCFNVFMTPEQED